jgi:hypothetical protein
MISRWLRVFMAMLAVGCATTRPADEAWHRPAPRELGDRLYRSDKTAVFPVSASAREGAVSRLASTPFVKISPREAEDLVGHPLGEGDYYLIRGVCIGCGTGSFSAHSDGENVVISHVSLAGRRVRPTRWPVVMSLEKSPGQVFVDYSAAE